MTDVDPRVGPQDRRMTRLRLLLTSLVTVAALAAVPASASADFGFLGDWGSTGDQNGQFHTPTYVDVAADGSVWVAEDDKRVQKFTADGQYLTQVQVGRFGAGPVAVDGAGNLYVGDRDNYQVMKFDPNGAPLTVRSSGSSARQTRSAAWPSHPAATSTSRVGGSPCRRRRT